MFRDDLRKTSEYGDTFVRLFVKEDLQKRLLPFSKSALELFRKYCFEECNDADRLKCILRPCTEIIDGNNRRLLDLYIDSGIKKTDLPLFCYSQRQQTITKLLSGKERRRDQNTDKKVFLDDFLDILFPKASTPLKRALQRKQTFIKTFEGRLEETDAFTVYQTHDSYVLFSNENDIFFMDLDRRIVTLNPGEHKVRETPELAAFVSFLSQKYNLRTELIENGFGWNYVQFQVYESETQFTKKEKSMLQEYLLEYRNGKAGVISAFNVSDKTVYVNADIYYYAYENEAYFIHNEKTLLVSSLKELFSAMKSIQEDITKKLKEKAEPDTKTPSAD